MNDIRLALKKGGFIFATTPFYKDKKRPQHLVHDIKMAKQFEKIGLELISAEKKGLYRIFKRIK